MGSCPFSDHASRWASQKLASEPIVSDPGWEFQQRVCEARGPGSILFHGETVLISALLKILGDCENPLLGIQIRESAQVGV